MRALLTLGKLVNMEVFDPDTGKTKKLRLANKWVASDSGGRTLHFCTVKRKNSKRRIPAATAKAHRKFHGKNGDDNAWEGDCPKPNGKLRQVGLVKAITYRVPEDIESPEKNPYHWHHAFGDTGHENGERRTDYPAKFYPALMRDARGNYFLKRRPGNIFKVTDWIIG